MAILIKPTKAFLDQKPGTSGLRKSTRIFCQAPYLENFVQSIFDVVISAKNFTLVLGGDGRHYTKEAIQIIVKMAFANGVERTIIAKDGLLSTPCAAYLIQKYQASGGIILTASHNMGGKQGDFGLKYNIANGSPAPEQLTHAIFLASQKILQYKTSNHPDISTNVVGTFNMGEMRIDIVDAVQEYADFMETIFDFPLIRRLVNPEFNLRIDTMNAVAGPYAKEIFIRRLGFAENSLLNAQPLPDFAGRPPDPALHENDMLWHLVYGEKAVDFISATDGDGDRAMICGKNIFVNPSDNLAIMTAHAHKIPAYRDGIKGVARSMPTSRAVDRVAQYLGIPCFETPTGWKFFASLLDAKKITLCGEESFGAGSAHSREKDGLWVILFWLSILAECQKSVRDILYEHWQKFGRIVYSRYDFDDLSSEEIAQILEVVKSCDVSLAKDQEPYVLESCEDFSYVDPMDGTIFDHRGWQLKFQGEKRMVLRISETTTDQKTLRIYFEALELSAYQQETYALLKEFIAYGLKLIKLAEITKRNHPSTIV